MTTGALRVVVKSTPCFNSEAKAGDFGITYWGNLVHPSLQGLPNGYSARDP